MFNTAFIIQVINVYAPIAADEIITNPLYEVSDYNTIYRRYGIRVDAMHPALQKFTKDCVEMEYERRLLFKEYKPKPFLFPRITFPGMLATGPLEQTLFSSFPFSYSDN